MPILDGSIFIYYNNLGKTLAILFCKNAIQLRDYTVVIF